MRAEYDEVLSAAAFILLAAPVEGQRPADFTGFDHRLHGAEHLRVTRQVGDRDFHAVFVRKRDEPVRLLQRGYDSRAG